MTSVTEEELARQLAECKAELATMREAAERMHEVLGHTRLLTMRSGKRQLHDAWEGLAHVLSLPHAKAAAERWKAMERFVKAAMELRRLDALSYLPPGKAPKVIDFTGAQAEYAAALAALRGEAKP